MGGWLRLLGIRDSELNLDLEFVNRPFSVQNTYLVLELEVELELEVAHRPQKISSA